MAWNRPERPDWVRAVNAGRIAPLADEARRPFAPEALIGEARAALGIADGGVAHDFGDEAFLEPLGVLAASLEEEARLTVVGRWAARRHILRLLEVKAQMAAWVRDHPAVVERVVEAPVFVAGAPRTGTTLLHALLAQDPASRAPRGWELLRPVPPLPAGRSDAARVALVDAELRLPAAIVNGLDSIHVYGAQLPKECLSAMSYAFRSEEFVARYHVPAYQRWLEACDMAPAYDAHRLVLRLLQSESPGTRWVLKSPVHLQALPALRAAYPDARVVITHRDPLTVLASVTSLIANLRWAHSDDVDFADIGRYHTRLYHRSLTALVDGAGAEARGAHHLTYAELVDDPLAAVGAIYDALGWQLDATVAEAMATYLAGRPKATHGVHRYDFADLGLDAAAERARFRRYLTHFGVPLEAVA
jgi:Sulfotransferase family